jgi:hypothetical protein
MFLLTLQGEQFYAAPFASLEDKNDLVCIWEFE